MLQPSQILMASLHKSDVSMYSIKISSEAFFIT
jgi:hypothetical protein